MAKYFRNAIISIFNIYFFNILLESKHTDLGETTA